MPRKPRIVAVGLPHHVTQRGNNQKVIFHDDIDRQRYLQLLGETCIRYNLRIWAYCLMPNHVHLVVVPGQDDSMSLVFRAAHGAYSQYANLRQGVKGHLFQCRYYSCPMDRIHRWMALAYVEQNPVRARLVDDAGQYVWSSARAHLRDEDCTGLLDMCAWREYYCPARWREVLDTSVAEEAHMARLREATRLGKPLGDQEFVKMLRQDIKESPRSEVVTEYQSALFV
jgi:putative transposase